MKYETPELTALTPAISAIQGTGKLAPVGSDHAVNEINAAYEDWE